MRLFARSASDIGYLTCRLRDGQNFLNRCTKPDRREFLKISQAVGVGFVIMGTIGYIVKLGMRPKDLSGHRRLRLRELLKVSKWLLTGQFVQYIYRSIIFWWEAHKMAKGASGV